MLDLPSPISLSQIAGSKQDAEAYAYVTSFRSRLSNPTQDHSRDCSRLEGLLGMETEAAARARPLCKHFNVVCHKMDNYFERRERMVTKTEALYNALLPMKVVGFDDIVAKASSIVKAAPYDQQELEVYVDVNN